MLKTRINTRSLMVIALLPLIILCLDNASNAQDNARSQLDLDQPEHTVNTEMPGAALGVGSPIQQFTEQLKKCLVVSPYKRWRAEIKVEFSKLQQKDLYAATLKTLDADPELREATEKAIAECNPFEIVSDKVFSPITTMYNVMPIVPSYTPDASAMNGIWAFGGNCGTTTDYLIRKNDLALIFPVRGGVGKLVKHQLVGELPAYRAEITDYSLVFITQTSPDHLITYFASEHLGRPESSDDTQKLIEALKVPEHIAEIEDGIRTMTGDIAMSNMTRCPELPPEIYGLHADGIAAFNIITTLKEKCLNSALCAQELVNSLDVSRDKKLSVGEITRLLRMLVYISLTTTEPEANLLTNSSSLSGTLLAINITAPAVVTMLVAAHDYNGDGFLDLSEIVQDREKLIGQLAQVNSFGSEAFTRDLRQAVERGASQLSDLLSRW